MLYWQCSLQCSDNRYSHYSPYPKELDVKKTMFQFIPSVLIIALLSFGCAGKKEDTQTSSPPPGKQVGKSHSTNVYTGKIVGKSNKAKTISIKTGKGQQAKTMLLQFDDNTTGVENAVKGRAAHIEYNEVDGVKLAVNIKPKLAKLPAGVTEIKTEELEPLLAEKAKLFLVDSRPASRYAQSHLPEAVSIPVPKLKKRKAELLPENKNIPLVFYCGGPT